MSDLISKSEYGKALAVKIETIRAKIKNCPNHFLAQSVINDWKSEIEGLYDAAMLLDKAPTVDAVEVVHGRWTDENGNITGQFRFNFMCSNCKQYQHSPVAINGEDFAKKHKYCHNCGAKMDEVSE